MCDLEFLDKIKERLDKAFWLVSQKNADYAGGSGDPFANFRGSEMVGVTVGRGILVRMMDKIRRVSNFLDTDKLPQVIDESLQDTLLDIINYAAILAVYSSADQRPDEEGD